MNDWINEVCGHLYLYSNQFVFVFRAIGICILSNLYLCSEQFVFVFRAICICIPSNLYLYPEQGGMNDWLMELMRCAAIPRLTERSFAFHLLQPQTHFSILQMQIQMHHKFKSKYKSKYKCKYKCNTNTKANTNAI